MAGDICTKKISDIQEEECLFIIPDYQRGYRWTRQNVEELLDDLYDFDLQDPSKDTFYCLQPVVVIEKKEKGGNAKWEVIDGQQRLTTIYILLSYLHKVMPDSIKLYFSIDYVSRPKSREFLENICQKDNGGIETGNIDFCHMKNAYLCIEDWFEKYGKKKGSVQASFCKRLEPQTRVIWYEPYKADEDIAGKDKPEEIFRRINAGKIELTNAELIKALFLKEDNFFNEQAQLRISGEWDNMEYALQNDSMWRFLTNSEPYDIRIDFIFEILAEEIANEEKWDIKQKSTQHFSFIVFYKYLKEKINPDNSGSGNEIERLWERIKEMFMTFEEWYTEREWYHYIGYLVTSGGKNIKDIYKEMHGKSEPDMRKEIIIQIIKTIKFKGEITDLEYGKHSSVIEKILLLFNIETIQSAKNSNARFEFNRYKEEKWDLEHIHSQESEKIPPGQRLEWLEVLKAGLREGSPYREKAEELVKKSQDGGEDSDFAAEFDNFYRHVTRHFSGVKDGEAADEKGENGLENIALLNLKINRSYKNSIFPVKRKYIIERDKNGVFIPICTKNVFLKYYSDDIGDMQMWTKQDRKCYLEEIKKTLKKYLDSDNGEDDE